MLTWALLFGTGVFLIGFAAAMGVAAGTNRAEWRGRLRALRDIRMSSSLQKWVADAEKRMNVPAVRRRGLLYTVLVVVLSLAGLWFGFFHLQNPVAGLLLGLCGVLLPEQVWYYRERSYREKILEQLGAAVRVFAAEYSDTPHMVRALIAAAEKLPDPIGKILRKAGKDLVAGKDRDDVLIELGRKLDSEYGRMFVQLLRLSAEDEAVKPLFSHLAARLAGQQNLIRKNRVELAADRLVSLTLNASVIPLYFLMRRVVPESGEFFIATAAGKMIVALCIGSVVAGMLLDRLIGGGESD